MEKRKHKFNIIDVIVIVLVAAAIIFAVIRIAGKEGEKNAKVTFVMQTDMIPEELSDNVSAGDPVYDGDTGRKIGEVVSCDSRPAQYTGTSSAGASVISEVSGYRQLYVTCEATAPVIEDRFEVGGVTISSGKKYVLMFPSLYCKAECITVDGTSGD